MNPVPGGSATGDSEGPPASDASYPEASEPEASEPGASSGPTIDPAGPSGEQAVPDGAASSANGAATTATPPHGDVLDDGASAEAQSAEVVADDLAELTARAEKADEYLALAQRTRADFENFRKRATRDAAAAQERGLTRLAKELLPAVDNLDRALAAAAEVAKAEPDSTHENLLAGVKLVHQDLLGALGRVGIEPYSPDGEPFDPQYHEAMAQQPVEGAQPGTVVAVYQRGYRFGETVLRPARVVVAG